MALDELIASAAPVCGASGANEVVNVTGEPVVSSPLKLRARKHTEYCVPGCSPRISSKTSSPINPNDKPRFPVPPPKQLLPDAAYTNSYVPSPPAAPGFKTPRKDTP